MRFKLAIMVSFNLFSYLFAADRDDLCTTPDDKPGTCIPANLCEEFLTREIFESPDSSDDYVKKAVCGFDTERLVCCESTDIDYLDVFTTEKPIPTTIRSRKNVPVSKRDQLVIDNFETNSLPNRTVCGLHREKYKIQGGTVTELHEFPWMAAIEYSPSGEILCGGSIINNRWVLTAAHCLISLTGNLKPVRVWLGEWRKSTNPDCQTFGTETECADEVLKLIIKKSVAHPYYTKARQNNDIGMIRLENDVKYTTYIRPICLPPPDLPNPQVNSLLTVAGWGGIENGSLSDVKLKVEIPLLVNSVCAKKLKSRIVPSQLCAGGVSGKDSCRGDSGGPLMRIYIDKNVTEVQWYQEGVVSYGNGCAGDEVPAVYTRVTRYIQWILDTMAENE